MGAVTEYGTVRQVWFAKLATPADKWSFLIRDDAYSKRGAVFGRTVRLGEPVTLGPNGTWAQSTWQGGRDQESWQDKEMYKSGTADATNDRGKLRLWNGWKRLLSSPERAVERYTFCRGNTGMTAGVSADVPLYIGEDNTPHWRTDPNSGTTVPPSGFRLYRYNPTADTITTLKSDFTKDITAMTPFHSVTDGKEYIFIALANGECWTYDVAANSFNKEVNSNSYAGATTDFAIGFNGSIYYNLAFILKKRDANGVHSSVTSLTNGPTVLQSPVIWNSKMWFLGVGTNDKSTLWVSDGAVCTQALEFPGAFNARGLAAHAGSLYIAGNKPGAKSGDNVRVGVIYKYNGSSLTELFTEGTGFDGEEHLPYAIRSFRKWVVWGRPGLASTGNLAGLMFYDAELDAIVDGPTFAVDSECTEGVMVTNIIEYDSTLAISAWDRHDYTGSDPNQPSAVMLLRGSNLKRDLNHATWTSLNGDSFEDQPNTKTQVIYSSVFDAGIPNEEKVWLTGRLQCRLAQASTQIVIKAILDENTGTEYTVKTVSYDSGNTAWRTVVFPMRPSTEYLRSTKIQYVIYLTTTDTSTSSTATPEVDGLTIDFKPAPINRRQWNIVAVCSDGQMDIGGNDANPLNTRALMVAKLEELWSEQDPVLFWDANLTDSEPSDNSGIEVNIHEFAENSYRVDSENDTINADVTMTIVENVIA